MQHRIVPLSGSLNLLQAGNVLRACVYILVQDSHTSGIWSPRETGALTTGQKVKWSCWANRWPGIWGVNQRVSGRFFMSRGGRVPQKTPPHLSKYFGGGTNPRTVTLKIETKPGNLQVGYLF